MILGISQGGQGSRAQLQQHGLWDYGRTVLSPNPCHTCGYPQGDRPRFLTWDSKPMTLTTAQGTGTHPKHWMCRGHWRCREAQEPLRPPPSQ